MHRNAPRGLGFWTTNVYSVDNQMNRGSMGSEMTTQCERTQRGGWGPLACALWTVKDPTSLACYMWCNVHVAVAVAVVVIDDDCFHKIYIVIMSMLFIQEHKPGTYHCFQLIIILEHISCRWKQFLASLAIPRFQLFRTCVFYCCMPTCAST